MQISQVRLRDLLVANSNLTMDELVSLPDTVFLRPSSSINDDALCSVTQQTTLTQSLEPFPLDPCELPSMSDSAQCDPSDVTHQIVVTVVVLISVWLLILLVVFALAFWGYHRRLNFPEPATTTTRTELKGFAVSTLPKFFESVRGWISSAKTRKAASQARQFMRNAGSERVQELMQESGFKEEILLESLTIWFELTE